MSVTAMELGRRIRAAREACRLTQEDLAVKLGVSRPTVVQMEAGKRSVSGLELDRLAYLLARDIRDFLADSFTEEDALAALFRAQPVVADNADVLDKVRECFKVGRELTNLENLLGLDRVQSTPPVHNLAEPHSRWDAIKQGEMVADQERGRLGLGVVPVSDLSVLIEQHGIRTGLIGFPDDVSGICIRDSGFGLFVAVNRSHHNLRRRFSFAHEYGHLLMDPDRLGGVSCDSGREDLIEVRANAFAAAFLMPEGGVTVFVAGLGKGRASRSQSVVFNGADAFAVETRTPPGSQDIQMYDVVQLAAYFGVSVVSALFRLRNLRLITDAELLRLQDEEQKGFAKATACLLGIPEPDHVAARNEFRQRFVGLALEAWRRDLISAGKLREIGRLADAPADRLEDMINSRTDDDDAGASEVAR